MPRPLTTFALVIAVAISGCVIPVAPQFDDPETNYPPFVVSSTPGEGDVFTQGAGADGREITVSLADHNLNDQLFIRWLVDYPGANSKQLRDYAIPAASTAERPPVRIQPNCDFSGLSPGPHRLVMSVSDRRYLEALAGESVSPEAPLDSIPNDGNRIRVVWLLNCP